MGTAEIKKSSRVPGADDTRQSAVVLACCDRPAKSNKGLKVTVGDLFHKPGAGVFDAHLNVLSVGRDRRQLKRARRSRSRGFDSVAH